MSGKSAFRKPLPAPRKTTLSGRVTALLARSAPRGDETDDEQPAWFNPGHRKKQVASPAQMFVGIENIGSTGAGLPWFLRPMRSWWPS